LGQLGCVRGLFIPEGSQLALYAGEQGVGGIGFERRERFRIGRLRCRLLFQGLGELELR
jgi:hypothetical protein